jgi:toxin ParE1/3/4
MDFKVLIGPEAYQDIQQGIDWYEQQREDFGHKFYAEVENTLNLVKSNPYFQVRYGRVRCIPLKKFPYMIHFTIDESNKTISIQSILHTSREHNLLE